MGKRNRKRVHRVPDREPMNIFTTTDAPVLFLCEGDFFRVDYTSRESGSQVFRVDTSDTSVVVARRAIYAFGKMVSTGLPTIFRQRELRTSAVRVQAHRERDYQHKHTHLIFSTPNGCEDACATCLHDTAYSKCPVDNGGRCAYARRAWVGRSKVAV
jgi:hypothetical protein